MRNDINELIAREKNSLQKAIRLALLTACAGLAVFVAGLFSTITASETQFPTRGVLLACITLVTSFLWANYCSALNCYSIFIFTCNALRALGDEEEPEKIP